MEKRSRRLLKLAKAIRFYKDIYGKPGTREEAIMEAPCFEVGVVACSGSEAKLLEILNRGEKPPENLMYKIAVACLLRRCYESRDYCRQCFFRAHCALHKNPKWFLKKDTLRPHVEKIIANKGLKL